MAVVDAMACIGGNALAFAAEFGWVLAMERDGARVLGLRRNFDLWRRIPGHSPVECAALGPPRRRSSAIPHVSGGFSGLFETPPLPSIFQRSQPSGQVSLFFSSRTLPPRGEDEPVMECVVFRIR